MYKAYTGVLKLVFIKNQVESWNCSHTLQKERFEKSMGTAILRVGLQKSFSRPCFTFSFEQLDFVRSVRV